jgi:glycosyltransferase involved in cell wall biosynthesis
MTGMVRQGKEFLESILQPVHPAYRCIAFRAGNWSVNPSKNITKALLQNGIGIDTSVFKYGQRNHLVVFDYLHAHSNLVPWRASENDMCVRDDRGRLWEFPIYAENRWLGAFLTLNRVLRATNFPLPFRKSVIAEVQAKQPPPPTRKRGILDKLLFPVRRHAWKADFNQCAGRQLIQALRRAEGNVSAIFDDVPFIAIGHSKLFNSLNERSLRPFLEFVAQNKDRFGFETFDFFQRKIDHENYLSNLDARSAAPDVDPGPAKAKPAYVLVTAARNEAAHIKTTIESVLSQTIPPQEWIIINDRSTDQTDEIVTSYAARHDFITVLRITGPQTHSFAAKIHAIETGLKILRVKDYAYIGLLDGDVSFTPEYYEQLIAKFELDPKLGLAGGLVLDIGSPSKHAYQNLGEVAGATQFFKRACFESLGGLMKIQEGGFDAVTCAQARMNGFRTATFPTLLVGHLKPRNIAFGHWWQRHHQFGIRDYVLGSHPGFEVVKCINRIFEYPPLVAAVARLVGYAQAILGRRQSPVPEDIRSYIRREQLRRLNFWGRSASFRKNRASELLSRSQLPSDAPHTVNHTPGK